MHPVSRRHFLTRSSSVALGFAGLSASLARGSTALLLDRLSEAAGADPSLGFGPLIEDPAGVIALPEGFSYRVFSRTGERRTTG
jgi:secreted PhoX family phosphatase